MMQLFRTVRVVLCLLICLMYASAGNADRIYLKDGTVVVSDKVWRTRDHIHFILKGTVNVEIRYANEIVAKVESQGKTFTPGEAPAPRPNSSQQTTTPPKPVNKALNAGENVISGGKRSQPSQVNVPVDTRAVTENRGLSFYDPRRGKRYWASRNSKHDTLSGALQALAGKYGRSTQWVASHMGEENNLSKIHANLIQRREMETSAKETQKSNQASAQKSFVEQDAANKIEKAPKSTMSASAVSQASEVPSNNGLEFYNPRREQKYWTGKMTRHNTLQEAIKALAEQYGVSTEWVESNMGNTNDLDTIHRNIQKSLQ
jgi:hypothetical protein